MRSIEDAVCEIDEIIASEESTLAEEMEYVGEDDRRLSKTGVARRAVIEAMRELRLWILDV